jgi:RNA polymerase sigma factor (sigma-70 family)
MSSSVDTDTFGSSVDHLYRLHAAAAQQVARSITNNADDAADAVAEAFTGVLEAMSAGRIVGPDAFRPYLLAATRNASIDILRQTGRLKPVDETGALDRMVTGGGPSDRLVAREDRALVAEAFAELPARWRAVLWLTEVERLAPRDAAPLLDLTPNAVAQLAVRARGRLRERYVQMHVRNHAAGDCLLAAEHLGGLVAGELTTTQANRVRGHLAECAACRDRLSELEDLELPLRRALLPLPLLLHRLRIRRWPWSGRRQGPFKTGSSWPPPVDPAASGALVALVSSPTVQHVAASVTAGLLALGIGAAVVRDGGRRPVQPGPAATGITVPTTIATVAAIGAAGSAPADTTTTAPPATSTSTTAPVTTTTTPPATTTATTPATTTPTTATTAPAAPAVFVPAGPLSSAQASIVALATVADLPVFGSAGAPTPRLTLPNPQPSGAPLVLLVVDRRPGWVQVLLPVRPNGSTGWIRADQATLVTHNFRIVVELAAHRLTAYQGTEVLLSEPVALGTRDAPTPGGLYYTKELVRPLNSAGNYDPNGPYGPYAYGLSGFSEVLYEFAGGDGQFGIHGTNNPAALGTDVSSGCIRISNAAITKLAGTLPLGVPVEIRP